MVSCILFLAVGLGGIFPVAASSTRSETASALQQRVQRFIRRPEFAHADWGIEMVSLRGGRVLVSLQAHRLLTPASNAKLWTAALALDRLGPNYRIRTSLYAEERPDADGVLHGDLLVAGHGDPAFSARFTGPGETGPLNRLVAAARMAGIQRVEGDLVGDEHFFTGSPIGSGWAWDDLQHGYGAAATALDYRDNCIEMAIEPGVAAGAPARIVLHPAVPFVVVHNHIVTAPADAERDIRWHRRLGANVLDLSGRIGLHGSPEFESVALYRPDLWFLREWKAALTRAGITVKGRVRLLPTEGTPRPGAADSKWKAIASTLSPPLGEIVRRTLKVSENLYAQLLLLQVGAQAASAGRMEGKPSTEEMGLAALDRFVAKVGVAKGEVLLQEGSGLARADLVTADAMVRLLAHVAHCPYAKVFREALPVAGVDGTLGGRLSAPPAYKRIEAKTGTLHYVSALSGYLDPEGREPAAFSILLNRYDPQSTGESGHAAVDAVAQILAGYGAPSSGTKLQDPRG